MGKNTSAWCLKIANLAIFLTLMVSQSAAWTAEDTADDSTRVMTTIPSWVDDWLGYDTSAMSDAEFDSMICIASALSMGTLITVVGGTAIVIGGHVGTAAAGTAIALPVLVSSMWSACALTRAVAPGVLWLHNRSAMLVNKLGGGSN